MRNGSIVHVVFVIIVGIASIVLYVWWKSGPISRPVRQAIIHSAEPLVGALYDYREVNGTFPRTISELVPEHLAKLPDLPKGNGTVGSKWNYRVLDNEEFQLYTRFMHWVGTYDVIVLRSNGEYPEAWETHSTFVSDGAWRHIIGAQGISEFERKEN